MTPGDPTDAARDDLAFLRGLVQSGADAQRPLGEAYVAGGVCYGGQILGHFAQYLGWAPDTGLVGLAIAAGPTVIFTALMIWISRRHRTPPGNGSVVKRAVDAVFGAIGLANVALIIIIGVQAARLHRLEVWLIYPCVVLAMQGAAWLAVYSLRKRPWIAAVAAGWFAASIGMGLSIGNAPVFMGITFAAFVVLMIAPGVYMMREPKGG